MDKNGTNPFGEPPERQFETKLVSAKPQFINTKISVIRESEDTYFKKKLHYWLS